MSLILVEFAPSFESGSKSRYDLDALDPKTPPSAAPAMKMMATTATPIHHNHRFRDFGGT